MPERQYMIDDLRVEDTWRLFHIISFILINRAYWKDLIQWLTQKVHKYGEYQKKIWRYLKLLIPLRMQSG